MHTAYKKILHYYNPNISNQKTWKNNCKQGTVHKYCHLFRGDRTKSLFGLHPQPPNQEKKLFTFPPPSSPWQFTFFTLYLCSTSIQDVEGNNVFFYIVPFVSQLKSTINKSQAVKILLVTIYEKQGRGCISGNKSA